MKTRRRTRRNAAPARGTAALALVALALLPAAAGAQVVEYYHLDALGNVRAISNQAGQIVRYHDYLPFGDEWNAQPDPQPRRFTGKERDTETGLDYFGARYYAASVGRFAAVDPVYTWKVNLLDPQRWNRYAYARNNPLRYVDPDGRELRITIYHHTLPRETAKNVADRVATNLRHAGVKNVTYELKAGAPGVGRSLTYSMLPTPHSHLLEVREGRDDGYPGIRRQEAGHNFDFGGHSAVAVSVVRARAKDEGQLVLGVANVATHEIAHDAISGHPPGDGFMEGGGASEDSWLFDPGLRFTRDQEAKLQREYNRPNEVEKH